MRYFGMIFFIVLIACGTDSSSPPNNLEGTWRHTNCQALQLSAENSPFGFYSYYSKAVVEFDQANVKYYEFLYSDSSCLTDFEAVISASGTYSFSKNESSGVDFLWKAIALIPKSTQSAQNFSSGLYCGFSDWKKDVESSIKGSYCSNWDKPIAGDSPVLQIFEIQNGRLWLGDSIFLSMPVRNTSQSQRYFEK